MRNLFKYIIASVTLVASALSFGSVALAQSVKYDKYITGPNEDGIFTLNLEAYVTGSITVTTVTAPSDIVLVLDYSSSMLKDVNGNSTSTATNQRINLLRNSVKQFVDIVKASNADVTADALGKHRLAFVLYGGGNVFTTTGLSLNTLLNVDNLTTTAASGSGNSYTPAKVSYSGDTNTGGLLSPSTQQGNTNSDTAMDRAKTILSGQDYSSTPNRTRVVVFFTDGAPGEGASESGWENTTSRLNCANNCIKYANDIKTSTTYPATVYSVGMFPAKTTADATTTYLRYVSSDETGKTAMPTPLNNSTYVNVSGEKSIIVSSSGALDNVFSSIASTAGGDYSAASASSVLVDIVASNFSIPTNANLGSVKVYEVPCTQTGPTNLIQFSPRNATGDLAWKDITNSVDLEVSTANGEVKVKGFDYGEKWCGWDASANNNTGAAHGSKLVLEIPISANDDIVGGPSLETNLPGSGITIKDKDGIVLETYSFVSPVVKVPVTIWIKKEGLLSSTKNSAIQGHEDDAVFTIRKTKFHGLYETDEHGNEFEGGKRIEYTYTKGSTKSFIVNGVSTPIVWTTFTKVSVNMKEGEQDGIVKISGLDPDYIYRIEEDAWAHLGYSFDPDATARYTLEWDATAGKYKDIENPFVFSNTPKTSAFYSEDVVRNVFNQGSAAPTN